MNRDEGRQRLREAQMLGRQTKGDTGSKTGGHDSDNKHIQVGEGKTW